MAIGDKYTCEKCGKVVVVMKYPHNCKGIASSTIEVHPRTVHVDSNSGDSVVHVDKAIIRRRYKTEWQKRKRAETQQRYDAHAIFRVRPPMAN